MVDNEPGIFERAGDALSQFDYDPLLKAMMAGVENLGNVATKIGGAFLRATDVVAGNVVAGLGTSRKDSSGAPATTAQISGAARVGASLDERSSVGAGSEGNKLATAENVTIFHDSNKTRESPSRSLGGEGEVNSPESSRSEGVSAPSAQLMALPALQLSSGALQDALDAGRQAVVAIAPDARALEVASISNATAVAASQTPVTQDAARQGFTPGEMTNFEKAVS